jgi:hypothetical protein
MGKFDDIGQLLNLLTSSHDEISAAADTIINLYGPLIKRLMTEASEGIAEVEVAHINKLITLGLTREEAVMLCLDIKSSMLRASNKK